MQGVGQRFVFVDHACFDLVGIDLLKQFTHFILCHLPEVELVLDHSRIVVFLDEVMCGAGFPSVDARFVLPLVVLPAQRECVLNPDEFLFRDQFSIPDTLVKIVAFAGSIPDVERPPPNVRFHLHF